jgi:MFS family permease
MTLVILFLVNVLNFYDRFTLGAVGESIRRDFHLNDAQLGGLTTAFTILYALAGWPLGRMADTRNRKTILVWGIAVWSGLTALGGFAGSYLTLLLTRVGVGIGEAACAPAATSWIGDATPPARRTRALAIFMMAVPIGGMLSFAINGPATQAFGWRVTLGFAAIPAMALIPAVLWLREPRTAGSHVMGSPSEQDPRQLARLPIFWWISVSGAVVNFALYSFSAFFAIFLIRYHHMTIGSAGLWGGIGSGIAGIAGALGAGALGDRVSRDHAGTRMRLAAVASVVAAPLMLAAISLPSGAIAGAITLMMLGYGLLQTYYGLVYAAMHDAVGPALRGTAMGAYFVVQYLGGAAWGPLVTGRLSDHFAQTARAGGASAETARAIGLHQAIYVVPALALVLAGVLWVGANASMLPAKLKRG